MATPLEFVQQARALLAEAEALLGQSAQTTLSTPDALGRALAAARSGDVLLLDPTLVYPTTLLLDKGVTLRCASPLGQPTFMDGVDRTGEEAARLVNVRIQRARADTEIVSLSGSNITLEGCRVVGDKTNGAKRGISANAANVALLNCVVDDCFSKDFDSQAVAAWDSPGPFLIDGCTLVASGECLLFGGSDAPIDRQPADIVVRNSSLSKYPSWRDAGIAVKNVFELKNARRVLVDNCSFQYCWGGGQTGYLIVLTPRNQGGAAPWSTVEDVTIQNCRGRYAAAAISMLGQDNVHPSGTMRRVTVRDCQFADIDPQAWGGSDKLIQIGDGPEDVTIDGCTFAGANIGSQVYFYGQRKAMRLKVTNNTWPPSLYGVFGESASVGKAWGQFVTDGELANNKEVV